VPALVSLSDDVHAGAPRTAIKDQNISRVETCVCTTDMQRFANS